MSSRCEGLLERVRATGLLVSGEPVVVMLSGGRDSVCLLDIAATTCGPGSLETIITSSPIVLTIRAWSGIERRTRSTKRSTTPAASSSPSS
ncbi:MAG: hypothetical protein ACKOH7_02515, partial [Solirubrobacterales bacterium]